MEDSADFIAIQDATKDGIQKFRIFLKTQIFSVVAVEIKALKVEIDTNFVESLTVLLRGYLLSVNGHIDERHHCATEIMRSNHEDLLATTSFTLDTFCERYKDESIMTTFPFGVLTDPISSSHFRATTDNSMLQFQTAQTYLRDAIAPILLNMRYLFIVSYQRCLKKCTIMRLI